MRVMSVVVPICLAAALAWAQATDTTEASPAPRPAANGEAAVDTASASEETPVTNDDDNSAGEEGAEKVDTEENGDTSKDSAAAESDEAAEQSTEADAATSTPDDTAGNGPESRPVEQTAQNPDPAPGTSDSDSAETLARDSAVSRDTSDSAAAAAEPSQTGRLTIRTEPPKALLIVDGMPVGETPAIVDSLAPGKHRLQISKKGHYTKRATVRVQAGRDLELTFELIKPCKLTIITTPDSATAVLNGVEVGPTPLTKSALKPGSYEVGLGREGFESRDTTLALAGGVHDTLRVALAEIAAEPDTTAASTPDPVSKKATMTRALISLGVFVAFALGVLIVEVIRD